MTKLNALEVVSQLSTGKPRKEVARLTGRSVSEVDAVSDAARAAGVKKVAIKMTHPERRERSKKMAKEVAAIIAAGEPLTVAIRKVGEKWGVASNTAEKAYRDVATKSATRGANLSAAQLFKVAGLLLRGRTMSEAAAAVEISRQRAEQIRDSMVKAGLMGAALEVDRKAVQGHVKAAKGNRVMVHL